MATLLSGIGLLLVALFMLLGFFASGPGDSAAVTALTFIIGVLLPGAGGAALITGHLRGRRSAVARREALRLQTHQAEILKLAMAKRGKLTLVEVIADTGVDPPTAEAALRGLVERGLADIQITDAGLLVYHFEDLEHLPEKARAKGLLDA
jgi:hypothetical protein